MRTKQVPMGASATSSQTHAKSDWVQCPICGEGDMRRTSDEEGLSIISCVNHNCGSNGGNNKSGMGGFSPYAIKPMSSAPKPKRDEYFMLLVLDEWTDMGKTCRRWKLAYWLDAFDGRPAGWHGENCGDLLNPVGWILTTADLPSE